MKQLTLFLNLLFLLGATPLSAQGFFRNIGCGSVRTSTNASFEAFYQNFISGKDGEVCQEIYRIPTVVHFITEGGISILSQSDVEERLQIVNDVYQKNGLNLSLELAKLDPHGNPTGGITQTDFPTGMFPLPLNSYYYEPTDLTKIIQWDCKSYLNMGAPPVCNKIKKIGKKS
ncbi:MAG: hypothetical protein RLZZ292_3583 [Bacteroidota bacterium]